MILRALFLLGLINSMEKLTGSCAEQSGSPTKYHTNGNNLLSLTAIVDAEAPKLDIYNFEGVLQNSEPGGGHVEREQGKQRRAKSQSHIVGELLSSQWKGNWDCSLHWKIDEKYDEHKGCKGQEMGRTDG